jgi:hypothetical protein
MKKLLVFLSLLISCTCAGQVVFGGGGGSGGSSGPPTFSTVVPGTNTSSATWKWQPSLAVGGSQANISFLGFLNDSNTGPVVNIDTPVGTSGPQQGALRVSTNGFAQYQACNFGNGAASFGANIFGSTVACPSIYTTVPAKNVLMSGNGNHQMMRIWQASTGLVQPFIGMNTATVAGTGFNFLEGWTGVAGTDTWHSGGTQTFAIKGNGSYVINGAGAGTYVKADGTGYGVPTGAGTTITVANGTATLGTSAIGSGTCAAVVTVTATGTATTDNIMADFNADPTGVTGYTPSVSGMLSIIKYPTTNNINVKVCNNTSASITPGAITLNFRVVR